MIISSGKCKPYLDRDGKEYSKERYVSSQPFMYDKQYNMRKLMELPIHLIEAAELDLLKENILCNLEWLTNKLHATSIR